MKSGRKLGGHLGGVGADCGLHPLIHTLPKFYLPQDIGSINKRSRSSAVVFKCRRVILGKKGVEIL